MNSKLSFPAVAALAGLLAVVSPATAQVEIGMDASFSSTSFDDIDQSVTQFNFPEQRVRAGFFASPSISVEPSLGFSVLDVADESITSLVAGLDLLFHFSPDVSAPQLFVAVGPEVMRVDLGDEGETQFGLGGDFGVKLPVARQMAVRLAGFYTRFFETEALFGSNEFGVSAGFSFFTK